MTQSLILFVDFILNSRINYWAVETTHVNIFCSEILYGSYQITLIPIYTKAVIISHKWETFFTIFFNSTRYIF